MKEEGSAVHLAAAVSPSQHMLLLRNLMDHGKHFIKKGSVLAGRESRPGALTSIPVFISSSLGLASGKALRPTLRYHGVSV